MNSNNNSNSNNNNENLFWKVFKNIYLFNKIINNLSILEDYDNFENRIKFKHIQSLELMLKIKQYELLKCKIKANEYLEITKRGISKLFKYLELSSYENDENSSSNNFIILNEILILLLNKYELNKSFNLISIAINKSKIKQEFQKEYYLKKSIITDNLVTLEILLNEPYSLNIETKLLEFSIQNCSPKIASILLNNSNNSNNLDKLISLSFLNKNYKLEMLELILLKNNNNYSNEPFSTSIISLIKESKYQNYNNGFESILVQLLLIKNENLKEKLLNYTIQIICNNNNNYGIKKEELYEIINNNSTILNKFKEIHKLLILNSNKMEFYNIYLNNYNGEIISNLNKIMINEEVEYCFLNFNINLLNYFISNFKSDEYIKLFSNVEIDYSFKSTNNEYDKSIRESNNLYEFIKIYTSITSSPNQDCNQEIKRLLFSSTNEIHYNKINESISQDCNLRKLITFPTKFNKVLINLTTWNLYSSKILIENTETLDWVFENSNSSLLKSKIDSFSTRELFQFENLELIKYAISKFQNHSNTSILYLPSDNNKNINQLFYRYTYLKSISNCDIETLKYIDHHQDNIEILLNSDKTENDLILSNLKNQKIENLISLINYLNDTGYKQFTSEFYKQFLNALINCLDGDDDDEKLSLINLKFNSFVNNNKFIKLLSNILNPKSIEEHSFKLINLIISSSEFKIYQSKLLDIENYNISNWKSNYSSSVVYSKDYDEMYDDFYSDNNSTDVSFNSNLYNSNDIINCIIKFLNLYKNQESDGEVRILKVYNNITNGLFKGLIQSKNSNFKQVDFIRSKILENGIKIKHTLFHSIYYLKIKSQKFINYIIDYLPFNHSICNETDNQFDVDRNYESFNGGYNITKYLDSNLYTWDFIFNNSFDLLLSNLINHLSHKPIIDDFNMMVIEHDFIYKSINSNLEFLLSIRKHHLFFNELEYIENELLNQQDSILIGNFQTISFNKTNTCCSRNCCDSQVISSNETNERVVFHLSNKVYRDAVLVLNSSSFSRFLKFCSYSSIINYLSSDHFGVEEIDNILEYSDLINHILKEHNNIINNDNSTSINFENWLENISKLLISESSSFVLKKYQNLFKNLKK